MEIFKKKNEEVVMLTKEESRKILDEAREKRLEKEHKKELKKQERKDKKLETMLNLNTPITNKVSDLITSGTITKDDLYDNFGKRKNFLDVIEKYDDHPEDDEPENYLEVDNFVKPFGGNIIREDDKVVPAFSTGYTIDEDGNVSNVTSSEEDVDKAQASSSDIQELIINDPIIKEVYPSINNNDIFFNNGLVLIKVRRDSAESESVYEVFRLDIVGKQIYIQAPLSSPIPNLETGVQYCFVSVPLCTDLGKEIIKNHNYVVDGSLIDINASILRDVENAA